MPDNVYIDKSKHMIFFPVQRTSKKTWTSNLNQYFFFIIIILFYIEDICGFNSLYHK